MIEKTINQELQKAVEHLRDKGVIKINMDIVEKTGYGKSTVSEYIGGKKIASVDFIKKFEETFDIKLSDFTENVADNVLDASPVKITLQDYINKIEEYGKKMEEQNQFLQNVVNSKLEQQFQVLLGFGVNDRARQETILEALAELGKKKRDAWINVSDKKAAEILDLVHGTGK